MSFDVKTAFLHFCLPYNIFVKQIPGFPEPDAATKTSRKWKRQHQKMVITGSYFAYWSHDMMHELAQGSWFILLNGRTQHFPKPLTVSQSI